MKFQVQYFACVVIHPGLFLFPFPPFSLVSSSLPLAPFQCDQRHYSQPVVPTTGVNALTCYWVSLPIRFCGVASAAMVIFFLPFVAGVSGTFKFLCNREGRRDWWRWEIPEVVWGMRLEGSSSGGGGGLERQASVRVGGLGKICMWRKNAHAAKHWHSVALEWRTSRFVDLGQWQYCRFPLGLALTWTMSGTWLASLVLGD